MTEERYDHDDLCVHYMSFPLLTVSGIEERKYSVLAPFTKLCVCACSHVCVSICKHVCAHTYACACMHMHVHMHVCVCVWRRLQVQGGFSCFLSPWTCHPIHNFSIWLSFIHRVKFKQKLQFFDQCFFFFSVLHGIQNQNPRTCWQWVKPMDGWSSPGKPLF